MNKAATKAVAVVGAQWGDEGKGKVTDLLGEQAQYVVRYQGGNNAGHTVVLPEAASLRSTCCHPGCCRRTSSR